MTRPDTGPATPNGSTAADQPRPSPQPSEPHAVPGPADPAVAELLGRIVDLLEHRPGPAPTRVAAPADPAASVPDDPAAQASADLAATSPARPGPTLVGGQAPGQSGRRQSSGRVRRASRPAQTAADPEAQPPGSDTGTQDDDDGDGGVAIGPGTGEPPGAADGKIGRRRRQIRLRFLSPARVAASVTIVVLAAATGWLGWDRSQSDALNAARSQAIAAASAVATKMATYSYTSLAPAFAAVEHDSTKAFAATYKKQSASLSGVLGQYKATSHGKVTVAAAEHVSASRVQVLVIVDQTIANSASSTPSTQANGLLLTMVHQGGRWLLANVAVR
ncbi:MAG: hypothetical protein M0029_01275 [Actinomycetota bacterium]|jgi:Mce-associated membrane protein|nr:hypothetical protein [Actinomycetota bacterium]